MRSRNEHPSEVSLKDEPASLNERATFGVDAVVRDPVSGRIFEVGSGALSRERQALLFAAEAKKGGRLNELEAALLFAQAEKPRA